MDVCRYVYLCVCVCMVGRTRIPRSNFCARIKASPRGRVAMPRRCCGDRVLTGKENHRRHRRRRHRAPPWNYISPIETLESFPIRGATRRSLRALRFSSLILSLLYPCDSSSSSSLSRPRLDSIYIQARMKSPGSWRLPERIIFSIEVDDALFCFVCLFFFFFY